MKSTFEPKTWYLCELEGKTWVLDSDKYIPKGVTCTAVVEKKHFDLLKKTSLMLSQGLYSVLAQIDNEFMQFDEDMESN